ncbi:MAG: rRNA maturation RNase YbeY [Anaerolineae bacterium]
MTLKHSVDIKAEVPMEEVDFRLLRVAALATLRQQGVETPIEMTVVITDDASVHDLNRRFRGVDRTTDVLAFAEEDIRGPFAGGAPGFPRYLGDIVISLERASEQAKEVGCALTEELELLIVHGTLHLLGHDHADPQQKARMWEAQSTLLDLLSIEAPLPE